MIKLLLAEVLAVGSFDDGDGGNVKTESLDVQKNSWNEESDYPYTTRYYCWYAVVHFEQAFIYFGGHSWANRYGESIIAKFDSTTRQWSKIGNLVTGRAKHGAIFDGSNFIVIGGGSGRMKTEKCTLFDSTMTCQSQQNELTDYFDYPELFLVEDEFCRNTEITTTSAAVSTTTTTTTAVLILNSFKPAIITDATGPVDYDFSFRT